MKRGLQKFSKEYLDYSKDLTPDQIMKFIEDFKQLHGPKAAEDKSILISLKVKQNLLNAFRTKAKTKGIPYQTLIKQLMLEWLNKP